MQKIDKFDFEILSSFSHKIFNILKDNTSYFKNINEIGRANFDLNANIKSYADKKNKKDTRELSIFEKDLCFININHIFINSIPDQLSTYQALHYLTQNIESNQDFQNPVLEKLLINALTSNHVQISSFDVDEFVENALEKYIPFSLSKSQERALENAWANEISYIQGPPGTGKSHTISAIVLSALAQNKKVLVVSQKPAALDVINKKLDPYLASHEEILGVCYYDINHRTKIKNYCDYLKGQYSKSLAQDIEIFKNQGIKINQDLEGKVIELKKEFIELEKALYQQILYTEKKVNFLKQRQRFSDEHKNIPTNFNFTKIHNQKKYDYALKQLEKICKKANKCLIDKFNINKFKMHIKDKFNIDDSWFSKDISYSSYEFIKLNHMFTEVINQNKQAEVFDIENIRKKIKHLETDITDLKQKLIKIKYKYSVLHKISKREYKDEISNFSSMLRYTNSRLIQQKMQSIDFNKILEVIPFWSAEIRDLGKVFPLEPNLFDLIIVDEASQVNLSEILPVFYRGKKICIVGDHKQLGLDASGLNFSLNKEYDNNIWNKYNPHLEYKTASERNLVVKSSSILDLIKNEYRSIQPPEEMLDEHFRSYPKLARYTAEFFYKSLEDKYSKLKIMTHTPDKLAVRSFQAIEVNGLRDEKSKFIAAEALEVINIIKVLISVKEENKNKINNKYQIPECIYYKDNFTIGVVSMLTDQCNKIEELIAEHLPNLDEKYELMVGTPEKFQGNERDIMFFSLGLDINCTRGTTHFNNPKRVNVATSRAKYFTYFIHSPFKKESFRFINRYLQHIKIEEGEIKKEDIDINENVNLNNLNKFEWSKCESEFEQRVYEYLEKYKNNSNNKISITNQFITCGMKRLDFVLFNHDTKKSVVIEVDGRHHFLKDGYIEKYTSEHIERMQILTRAGWKIINTSYHKWYKNGWLCEDNDKILKDEIERIYIEIGRYIF